MKASMDSQMHVLINALAVLS
jgi:hypothetical protein